MTLGKMSRRIIGDRIEWIEKMIMEIQALPLDSYENFTGDSRNIWAAESCLRRALEALFDMGRHILTKSFGKGVSEYKEIAKELEKIDVLSADGARLLRILAGYRNRLVHFYHEVTIEELYRICRDDINDIIKIKESYIAWINSNPDRIDEAL